MKTSQSGSHVIALALFLLVVGAVGFAGYRVWQMQAGAPTSTGNSAADVSVPATITNKATLNQAATVLDQSSTKLNASLDSSALDADLNSLL